MKILLENWSKYLNEEENTYEMEVALRAEKDTQIYGVIFDKIRAIKGVTIIKSASKVTKDSVGAKYLKINIKFIVNPATGIKFLDALRNDIRGMTDLEGDKITSVRITKMPKPIEK
tara:strand:+ start:534 stop:881 length:348 start_codon:yes stop_codon:yes gene_type:complete